MVEAPSKEENLAVWNQNQTAWGISEDTTGITNFFNWHSFKVTKSCGCLTWRKNSIFRAEGRHQLYKHCGEAFCLRCSPSSVADSSSSLMMH